MEGQAPLIKPTFRQLHAELSGEFKSTRFTHKSVFVMLDRSTRNGGCRRLKDLRCQGRAAGDVAWPNPGVYTVPELALRIVRALEQDRQCVLLPRERLCPIEAIAFLSREEPQVSPRVHQARYECFRLLRMCGLSFERWATILREFEENESAELKTWTERILAYLKVCGEASARGILESDWDVVRFLCEFLESNPGSLNLDWSRVTERNPLLESPQPVELVVPALKEPYPLERRLLRALARHVPLRKIEAATDETSTPADIIASFRKWPLLTHLQLSELDSNAAKQKLGIYWGFDHDLPGPSEVTSLIPSHFLIDLPETRPQEELAFVRALRLWCDYHRLGRPGSHAYARDESFAEELRSEGFPVNAEPSLSTLRDFVLSKNPQRASELATIANGELRHLADWVCVFEEHDFFCFETLTSSRPVHARVSPRGVDLFCIEDLPFGGHPILAMWTRSHELDELCDPLSSTVLKKRPLPPKLAALLEREGATIPDPSREASGLRRLLVELGDKLATLDLHRPEIMPLRESPLLDRVEFGGEVKLSPSTVEQYFRCHFKFYLSRLLGLSPDNNWDPAQINVLSKGTWIHKALEHFFKDPDWESPVPKIHASLLESIDEVFDEKVSESYKKILRADAEVLAGRLGRYLASFERDLQTRFPERRALTELWIDSHMGGESIRGSVDRLDILPSGEALLWDYKSGSIEASKPLTQIRGGRMQWFIYREMIHALSASAKERLKLPANLRVIGGGYVNPLLALKSSLFIYSELAPQSAAWLEANFKKHHHPARLITNNEDSEISGELATVVRETAQSLRSGDFSPRPRRESECVHCEHQALCGRPFLREAIQ